MPVIHLAFVTPKPVEVVLTELTATLRPVPEKTVIVISKGTVCTPVTVKSQSILSCAKLVTLSCLLTDPSGNPLYAHLSLQL